MKLACDARRCDEKLEVGGVKVKEVWVVGIPAAPLSGARKKHANS